MKVTTIILLDKDKIALFDGWVMKKALVADDDQIVRTIVCSVAQSMGFVTIEASDGELARNILRDNRDVSLLITDMMMPKVDGRELIKCIRGNSQFEQLPIIIMSGVVKLSDITDILELGASRFLPKPIDTEYLRQYILKSTNPYSAHSKQLDTISNGQVPL